VLEKATRNVSLRVVGIYPLTSHKAADLASTTRLVTAIAKYSYDARDYKQLNASITLLSKKHGQLKTAVQALVNLAMDWLDEIKREAGVERWLELVETLRLVTEGKVRELVPFYYGHLVTILLRFSLKLPGLASPFSWHITTSPLLRTQHRPHHLGNNALKLLLTYSLTCKWRHIHPWNDGRRRNSSWSKCGC
jgi:hypothetical protein